MNKCLVTVDLCLDGVQPPIALQILSKSLIKKSVCITITSNLFEATFYHWARIPRMQKGIYLKPPNYMKLVN